jgi:Plasma-membrane choline transporter
MYGYSFMQGGEKAIQLFETREWMDVVNDNLIHNVLFMASVVLGGSTGVFGVLMEEVDGYTFTSFHKPIITAFV